MDKFNYFSIILLILLGLMIAFILFSLNKSYVEKQNLIEEQQFNESNYLPWYPEETIHINYDKCKNLNRSKYINRIIKKDFRIPMCPESYVVLYDKSQKIVFIFNENKHENPKILTIDVSCDNSTGKC